MEAILASMRSWEGINFWMMCFFFYFFFCVCLRFFSALTGPILMIDMSKDHKLYLVGNINFLSLHIPLNRRERGKCPKKFWLLKSGNFDIFHDFLDKNSHNFPKNDQIKITFFFIDALGYNLSFDVLFIKI